MGAYRLLRGSLHVWLLRIVARLAVLPGIWILVWLGVCSRHHGRHISRCWRICLLLRLILLLLLLLLLWGIGLPWADAVLGRVALLLTVWRHLLLAGIICCWRGLLARVIAMMWLLLLRGSLHARCCQCKPSGFLNWMVAWFEVFAHTSVLPMAYRSQRFCHDALQLADFTFMQCTGNARSPPEPSAAGAAAQGVAQLPQGRSRPAWPAATARWWPCGTPCARPTC